MKTSDVPVKINADDPEKIATLFGVGAQLAARIVERRQQHGFFHTPEDLAQVEGISEQHAMLLSVNIDWEIPRPDEPAQRSPFLIFIGLAGMMVNIYTLISVRIPSLSIGLRLARETEKEWIILMVAGPFAIINGLFAFSSFLIFLLGFSFHRRYSRAVMKIVWVFGGTAVLLFVVVVAGNVIYHTYYSPDGWRSFWHPLNIVSALNALGFGFTVIIPLAFTYLQPVRRFATRLARVYDAGFFLLCISQVLSVWSTRGYLPLLTSSYSAIYGLFYIVFGVQVIRSGESMFGLVMSLVEPEPSDRTSSQSHWMRWINARLPSPEEQQELQKALNQMYPPSRIRSIIGAIVVGFGGWLVVTASASIVDWIIQKFLNRLLP